MRDQLGTLTEHQQHRQRHIADAVGEQKRLTAAVEQIDAALDRTRPARVVALAEDPPEYLVARLGPAPPSPAGKAVWRQCALRVEAVVDRANERKSVSTKEIPNTNRVRQEIAVADHLIKARKSDLRPADWVTVARQASSIVDQAHRGGSPTCGR